MGFLSIYWSLARRKKVNTRTKIHHSHRVHAAIGILIAAACLILLGCTSLARQSPGKPFTFVVLPDTQFYSLRYPDIFAKQLTWVKEQKEARNIACVIHEGDITDGSTEKEWKVADQAMSVIDGVVPYCMVMGNHDYGKSDPAHRNAARFNKHFGIQRFEKQPWYGGHFGEGNENAFYLIRVEGMDFLILCLEFGPRDEVLEWANRVVAEHKHHRVIVVTHCYMYLDGTRVGKGDKWNPHDYGVKGNDGDEIWEKFASKHKNIFLVLSGHIVNEGHGRLASIGSNGNKVDQILADYQEMENGGNGWLRIMEFRPAENKIVVTTYSPFMSQYAEDPENRFEIEYSMN